MTQHGKDSVMVAAQNRTRLYFFSGGIALLLGAWTASATAVVTMTQSKRRFTPQEVELERNGTIRFVNDDGTLLHHVFAISPAFRFDSGEQEPGMTVETRFTSAGTFTVLCGIHPKMRLAVTVR